MVSDGRVMVNGTIAHLETSRISDARRRGMRAIQRSG